MRWGLRLIQKIGDQKMRHDWNQIGSGLFGGGFLALLLAFALLGFGASTPSAQKEKASATSSLPMAKPEEVGFSSERLQRIHAAMQRHIDAGEIAGVTTLVAHNGKIVYFDPQGSADLDTKKPMQKDNVF